MTQPDSTVVSQLHDELDKEHSYDCNILGHTWEFTEMVL